jgi:hypothetical protein
MEAGWILGAAGWVAGASVLWWGAVVGSWVVSAGAPARRWQRTGRSLGLVCGWRAGGPVVTGTHRGFSVAIRRARHQAVVGWVTSVRLVPRSPLPAGLTITRHGPTQTPPASLAHIAADLLQRAPLSTVDPRGLVLVVPHTHATRVGWAGHLNALATLAARWDAAPVLDARTPHLAELERLADPRIPSWERDALVRLLAQAPIPLAVEVETSLPPTDRDRAGRTVVGWVGTTRIDLRWGAGDSERIRCLQPGSLLRVRAQLSHFDARCGRPVFTPVA